MKGLSWSIAYLIAEEFDIPQFFTASLIVSKLFLNSHNRQKKGR